MKNTDTPAQLLCQVCGGSIQADRAKKRSNTCATPDCVNALRRFRAAVLQSGKCPHCYHPSTPEEWERFRRWRHWEAAQNDSTLQAFMKAPSGMTLRSVTRKLSAALADALEATQAQRELIVRRSTLLTGGEPDLSTLPDGAREEIERLDKLVAPWAELLETARNMLPEKAVDAKAAD